MMGFMRRWHRYLGVAATLLVILVSITGILLIHKKDLGLNKVMLDLPGYAKKQPLDGWSLVATADGHNLLSSRQGIFIEDHDGWRKTSSFVAKKLHVDGEKVYACTPDGLQQSDDGGETWRNVLPGQEAKAICFSAGQGLVATTTGIYRAMQGGDRWQLAAAFGRKALDVREIKATDEGFLLAAKEGLYRLNGGDIKPVKLPVGSQASAGVELQKVITDLHTGAFFGGWFMLVVDVMALTLVFLAVSGIWIWYQPWKARRMFSR
jgi:hypothetical protein